LSNISGRLDNPRRGIGSTAVDLIAKLKASGTDIFRLENAARILRCTKRTASKLLHDLVRKGWLFRLKGGLYLILPLEAGHERGLMTNLHVVAKELAFPNPYYLGYYSALEIHDLLTHPLNGLFIASPVRRASRAIGRIQFQFILVPRDRFWGFQPQWVTPSQQVQVSDLEKTLVDGAWEPQHVGGIPELATAMVRARDRIDLKKLIVYVKRFGKVVVAKRLGFLLETLKIIMPGAAKRLQPLAATSRALALLDPTLPAEGRVTMRWRIRMNVPREELAQTGRS
jgi:predicted transcriptional regulator of viral defense system